MVIGARGGIGAALERQLQAQGRWGSVIGLHRRSPIPLDLMNEATIAAAAMSVQDRLRETGQSLQRLIVATGFLHGQGHSPERSWRDLNATHLAHAFAVNAIGPALVMKHWLPLLPRDTPSVFAVLSARVGSIGDNQLGGWYAYRASKAALNQLLHTAAIESRRRCPQAICVALHPGTVDTALSAPFAKRGLDVRPPDVAAQDLLAVMDRLQQSDSGGFFDHKGRPIEW